MYDKKINNILKQTETLLKSRSEITDIQKSLKIKLVSLKEYFSVEYGIIINDLTKIIEEISKSSNETKIQELDEDSPAGKHVLFRNDEIFNLTRIGTKDWEMYTLADPMILNNIYKLRISKFNRCRNGFAINVGVSLRKLHKFLDGGISQTYGYLVKNGQKYNKGTLEYSQPAVEGDVIGVSLSEGEDDKYNLEIYKNGENLGIAYTLEKTDYYFYYGLCNNTEIEISDCYNHYYN